MIVTYDPGLTTGWASLHNDEYEVGQIDSSYLPNVVDHLNSYAPEILGYEDFKHRPQMISSELYSMQVIGVIRLWRQILIEDEPFCYLPAQAKAFWSDDKIKALHLWNPGQPDAMDALRVLLTYQKEHDSDWFNSILPKLKNLPERSPKPSRREPPNSQGPNLYL